MVTHAQLESSYCAATAAVAVAAADLVRCLCCTLTCSRGGHSIQYVIYQATLAT
jgi:hypothetical protein